VAPESNIQEVDFPVARGRDIPGLDGLSMVHDEMEAVAVIFGYQAID